MLKNIFLSMICIFTLLCQAAMPKPSFGTIERLSNFPSQFVPARHIDIWFPQGYSNKTKYAVLYMHDGQMLFDGRTTWNQQEWRIDEVGQALINQGKVQPFIVVGIHNGEANRHAEYFPERPFHSLSAAQQQLQYQQMRSEQVKLFSKPVYSDRYLKFLVSEVKPYIDSHFSVYTDQAHTFVMGSSMGGLISMYAMTEYPDIFGGAACLSTHWPGSFMTADNPVPAKFFAYLTQHLPAPAKHKFYFDHGDQTLDAWYPPLQKQVDTIMQQKNYGPDLWQTKFFPGAEHSEQAWAQRLDVPLRFLLAKQPNHPAKAKQ
jgi:enterochelin esterase-like enzyme